MELLLIEMKAMGYNTVRVNFDPSCTGSQYMSAYSATNLQRAIQIAQHFSFWIIIDYHGYSEVFNSTTGTCWLNFWSGVTNQFKNSYSQIIWEPLNEPCYDASACAGYSTNNNMCSGASACVAVLSKEYQLWINQTRAQGDTHWIVVQNICSYGCSLSNWASGFPTVTDPLGKSPIGKIFISLHSYMGYSSSNWNNATADSMAQQYYQAVLAGMATSGWPALNTEGGADPLCTSCAPDKILTGSAGYTTTTFHFIQALTNLYDSNTPQRINWIWWPAGSWTDTPNAGIYGAMQCASSPPGWGCLLKFLSLGPPGPDFTMTATIPAAVNTGQSASSTITTATQNGFTGTITLAEIPGSGLTCSSISPISITGSGTATVSCSSSVAGLHLLEIIGTSGAIVHITIATFNFIGPHVPPTLSVPSAQTVNELTTLTFKVSATDASTPSPILTMSGSQLPLGGSFSSASGIAPSGTFSWTPSEAQAPGTFTVTFSVTDGTLSSQAIVIITVIEPTDSPTITVPGAQSATVGTTLSFTVYAKDPLVPTEGMNLTATGLAPNMTFNRTSGAFTFTPTQNQLGQTFIINFAATDPSNPSASSNQSLAILVASSANQPSGGGFCLICILPNGFSLTMWLLIIGGLIGVISSIALLNIRAHAELVGVRRRHQKSAGVVRYDKTQTHSEKVRAIMEHHHRTPTRNYEDN
jgi:hypothetical protein